MSFVHCADKSMTAVFLMVPSARLELAQLSPLPPQDSVSTNFTTTAMSTFLPRTAPLKKPLILTLNDQPLL